MIDPKKDLDGISPENIAKVFAGDSSGFAPCTAEAVMEVLRDPGGGKTGDRGWKKHGGWKTTCHVNVKGQRHCDHVSHKNP